MTYDEQIRAPEWIQLATSLKEKHDWTCQYCQSRQSKNAELTIHHIYYLTKTKLWNHPEPILEVACWSCHKTRQALQRKMFVELAEWMKHADTESLTLSHFREHAAFEYFVQKDAQQPCLLDHIDEFRKGIATFMEEFPDYADCCNGMALTNVGLDQPNFYKWDVALEKEDHAELINSQDFSYRAKVSLHASIGRLVDIRATYAPGIFSS